MNSVELFTGAGGLAMGAAKAGFHHLAVVERDKYACDTIRENQRRDHALVADWPLYEGDVRNCDYRAITESVDLVAGGPPCQPFSLGGKHKAFNDERDMFPEAVRAIRELRPRAFVFENVKGLTRQSFATYFSYIYLRLCYPEHIRKDGEAWERHLERLERHHTSGKRSGLHYRVVHRLVNAADYGVPQRRERVFFVGFRSDIREEWSFPEPTHTEAALLYEQYATGEYWDRHEVAKRKRLPCPAAKRAAIERMRAGEKPHGLPWHTLRDARADLPEPTDRAPRDVYNHILVPGARSYPGHTGSPLDLPAKTLKAGVHGVPGGENMIAFPDGSVRYLTVRESARVQTFPDDYVFHGSWSENMRQLGNAVPMRLAELVARSVRERLDSSGKAV